MWICTNTGFVSVVADRDNKDRVLVRARREDDLRNVLGDLVHKVEIFTDKNADYKWRAFVDRGKMAEIIACHMLDINYGNFKNSVKDPDLHDLYADMWDLHYRYQKNDPN